MYEVLLLTIYFFILFILSIYGLHRYQLMYLYYKHKNICKNPQNYFEDLPKITVQLPIFNEMYVVERLIDNVVKLDYPKELLQIQVLDDSTDETTQICQHKVKEWQNQGIHMEYIHRNNRSGFKAGALENGMKTATGEFIAIFDADFVPHSNFLQKTIHYFMNEKVGLVQARWEHLNRDFSILTQVQSIFLDGHFMIEQTARNTSGRYFNFNGTAGLWRKKTIIDAGGWHHDTLTEDMDLSFRAQLKGWEFIFLPHVVAPAELPITINAFKSQQHRWAKGAIQVCKKLLIPILKSKAPIKVKMEAAIQLTNNLAYPLMFLFSILMFPALVYRTQNGWQTMIFIDMPLFIAATISVSSFYAASQIEIFPKKKWHRLKYLPVVTSIGIGICVSNSKAVIEALLGYKSGFVRTPKYNNTSNKKSSPIKYQVKNNILPLIELFLAIYFACLIYVAYILHAYLAIPFILLFFFGYTYVGTTTLWQKYQKQNSDTEIDEGKETLLNLAS